LSQTTPAVVDLNPQSDGKVDRGGWFERTLVCPEWTSLPGRISFVYCLVSLAIFAGLWASGDHGAFGVVVELGIWVPLSLLVARFLRQPLGPATYLLAVIFLALVEESIAFYTGGGLHGTATSLPQDWVRAVPTFLGIAVGMMLSVRWLGLTAPESFATAALAGIVIELGLGDGFNPLALIALAGGVAWLYGTILALPLKHATPPSAPWARGLGTVAVVGACALAGGFLGLFLQLALGL